MPFYKISLLFNAHLVHIYKYTLEKMRKNDYTLIII